MKGHVCDECGDPFTLAQWENRHDTADGLGDLHAECCELAGPCSQPEPEPGVDYHPGACDLCGESAPHDHPPEEYGTYYPDPDRPRQ